MTAHDSSSDGSDSRSSLCLCNSLLSLSSHSLRVNEAKDPLENQFCVFAKMTLAHQSEKEVRFLDLHAFPLSFSPTASLSSTPLLSIAFPLLHADSPPPLAVPVSVSLCVYVALESQLPVPCTALLLLPFSPNGL